MSEPAVAVKKAEYMRHSIIPPSAGQMPERYRTASALTSMAGGELGHSPRTADGRLRDRISLRSRRAQQGSHLASRNGETAGPTR